MRIVDDAHRDTSTFTLDTRTEYSGRLAEDGSPRPRPNASRHKFAAAISWLAAHLIESLAAYGEAMYPYFVDPGDLTNGQKPEWDSEGQRPAEFEHRSEVQWLSAGASRRAEDPRQSASVQTASPGSITKIMSPVVRFWARTRAERRVRLTITKLAALDDHTLNDIGIHRCQIGSVVRHSDRYRW
jgi:uncharacterized protein YjiS (DUF1127 family)